MAVLRRRPDDQRFEDFFVFDYPNLVGALRLVTGDAERAQDAVDEACARAWERLARGRSIDVLGAWIRVVAFNVARDKHRRRRTERLSSDRLTQRRLDAERELSADVATAIDVETALAHLTQRQREVVVLFYFLDFPVDSIAAELKIPAGTVKATLHRARAELAARLNGDAYETGRIGRA